MKRSFPVVRVFGLLILSGIGVTACAEKAPPCALCYEDEWSREPFPGQTKQHLPTLTPEQLKSGAPVSAREFLGAPPREDPY